MSEVAEIVAERSEVRRPSALRLGAWIGLMLLIWAVNFVVAKVGLQHMDVFTLAAFRVELAAILLGVMLWVKQAREGGSRKLEKGDLWTFAYLGFFMAAVNQMCFTIGLNYTSVGHASLIIGTGPILVLLLAWAQGLERLTVLKVTGMALSFAGVTVLAAEEGLSLRSGRLLGDMITLAGSVGFACYAVWGKKVAAKYDTLEMNAYNYFAGALVVLPLAVWQAVKMTREGSWGAVGWQGWAATVYMAAFASVAAYLIYYWALRYLAASRLSAFSYLLPVMATCLGVLLLPEERVTGHLLGGGALVLVGVYLAEVHRRGYKLEENDD